MEYKFKIMTKNQRIAKLEEVARNATRFSTQLLAHLGLAVEKVKAVSFDPNNYKDIIVNDYKFSKKKKQKKSR